MKKIMFNDKYGLTDAVLQGRKTMTRRIIKQEVDSARRYNPKLFPDGYDPMAFYHDGGELWRLIDADGNLIEPAYKIGEAEMMTGGYDPSIYDAARSAVFGDPKGWKNKMFVRTELMPHQIRITDIKVERLQDISDEDCLKEGIIHRDDMINSRMEEVVRYTFENSFVGGVYKTYATPREVFAALIDKVSGKGTWNSNPYVFAYTFELVK